jgi:hypothetical protein
LEFPKEGDAGEWSSGEKVESTERIHHIVLRGHGERKE